jgi:hypothetical protein
MLLCCQIQLDTSISPRVGIGLVGLRGPMHLCACVSEEHRDGGRREIGIVFCLVGWPSSYFFFFLMLW